MGIQAANAKRMRSIISKLQERLGTAPSAGSAAVQQLNQQSQRFSRSSGFAVAGRTGWVGSNVVHLGDHCVPNALCFMDKYSQIGRVLGPIVAALDAVDRIAAGGGRRFDTTEASRLRRINAEESANLANAFVSDDFMSAMYDFNTKRKKSQLKNMFWIAKTTLPLWQPAKIAPSYEDK